MLLVMIAFCVVIIIRMIGLILIIAFFTIAPYVAERHSRSLSSMMVFSILYNFIFTALGLWCSYMFNLTSGAAIIMVAAIFFFFSLFLRRPPKAERKGGAGA